MKIIGIEHIGIAVKDLDKDALFWSKVLGIERTNIEDVDDQGVITDIYDTGRGKIELLLSKYPDSPIEKFLKNRGPGIHHICMQVEDLEDAMEQIKNAGGDLVEPVFDDSRGRHVFVHPKFTGGFLLGLIELHPGQKP